MHAFATEHGEDPELWGLVGLLHDFDYERWPEIPDHPLRGSEVLRERGYPEEVVRAIQCHCDYLGIERRTPLEKTIFATDELVGFLYAVTYVRPSRDIRDVQVASVRKKWKQRSFAAGVLREDVEKGCAELGVDLWGHVGFVLGALQERAEELGLAGAP